MNYELLNNNKAIIAGEIYSELKFSHEVKGEVFYELMLAVKRKSNYLDIIPITISERLILDKKFELGQKICIKGQFRSHNKVVDNKSKLLLTVFAREIENYVEDINQIEVNGIICKTPIYRNTPLGREIADTILAVNRAYNKRDYIPCIAWGRDAKYINSLNIGDKICIIGRMQSREYKKEINGEVETNIAYEVSIFNIYKECNNDNEI